MKTRVGTRTDLRLLVQADASLPLQDLSAILELATAAGFVSPQLAVEPPVGAPGSP
jgi:biopolymer transport protein ExbD